MIWATTTQDPITEEWIVAVHDSKLKPGMSIEEAREQGMKFEVYRGKDEKFADELHLKLKVWFGRAARSGAALERQNWSHWMSARRKEINAIGINAAELISGANEYHEKKEN